MCLPLAACAEVIGGATGTCTEPYLLPSSAPDFVLTNVDTCGLDTSFTCVHCWNAFNLR